MGALTPAGPTASRAGAVTPITGRAATAPGLPYRHTLISTGTDRSDRWVTSGCLWTSIDNEVARCRASWRATGGVFVPRSYQSHNETARDPSVTRPVLDLSALDAPFEQALGNSVLRSQRYSRQQT